MEDFNSKYTGEEVENILDSVGGKQDAISDLETIRDGASKGATALQSSDIDAELNIESSNPIQNKVVTEALNTIIDDTAATASAVKSAYDLAASKASMSEVNTAIANAITNAINASY